jgi:hypothetical protein
LFAEYYLRQLEYYRNPLCFPEDNDWGHIVALDLLKSGYKNIGFQDEKKTKIGFNTKGGPHGGTRMDLYGALIPAINNHQIIVYNKDGVKQLFDLIRNTSKEGRIEARRGGHDDYAIMLGICWLMKDKVIQADWEPKVLNTLHFRPNGRRNERQTYYRRNYR